MTIRLLTKQEIVKLKAVDRQKEIDEGLKLARRVDTLRETQAKEEAELEKFRRETLASIGKEIDERSLIVQKMIVEVKDLQEKRIKALKPIDDLWKTVKDKEKENLDRENEIAEEQKKIQAVKIQIDKLEKEKNFELLRVTNQKELAEKEARDALNARVEAKIALESAETIKSDTIKDCANKQAEIEESYKQLAKREEEVKIKEKKLSDDTKWIAEEKIRLADQRQTLERAFNRLKK